MEDLTNQGLLAYRIQEGSKYKWKIECLADCQEVGINENDIFEADDYLFKAKIARTMPTISQNVGNLHGQEIHTAINQIFELLAQRATMLQNIQNQLVQLRITTAKAFNASATRCTNGTHLLEPVPNIHGNLPAVFPATLGDFINMTGPQANSLFQHLEIPIPDVTLRRKRNQLAVHLGIRYHDE